MAGETPNASRVNKKRKLSRQDDRSTNKTYASGNVSAIDGQRTAADSTLKPGQKVKGRVAVNPKANDRSADKYYRNNEDTPTAAQTAAKKQKNLGKAPKLTNRRAAAVSRAVSSGVPPIAKIIPSGSGLLVMTKDDVQPVLTHLVEQLNAGGQRLVVYVRAGDNDLLRRTRAACEQLMTRELITEEQYHEVRLSYQPNARPPATPEATALVTVTPVPGENAVDINVDIDIPCPVLPTTTVNVDEDEDIGDPLDFLYSPDAPEKVDTTPTAVIEVDLSDADADSFLAPDGPAASEDLEAKLHDLPADPELDAAPETTETTSPVTENNATGPLEDDEDDDDADPPAKQVEAKKEPKKRGRRTGRGSED